MTATFCLDSRITDDYLQRIEQRLPTSMNDERVRRDAQAKVEKLRLWMVQQKLDSVLISRYDNFAWLTCGGDNRVLKNTETGAGHLLLTADRQYLLAYSMDGERILEEQIPAQGYQLETVRWYEGDPRHLTFKLGGKRIAADTALPGAEERTLEIHRLHEPLTELEIDRCRWLGRQSALLLEALARRLHPGMTEEDVARETQCLYSLHGIELIVLLVGSDARAIRLRHSVPSGKRIEKYILLHPAARRWGLHANICRSIHFGKPEPGLCQTYHAAATIYARTLGMLQPSLPFANILAAQKTWYADLGYTNEWREHFQGGPCGYIPCDPTRCFTAMHVVAGQAYDWFITLPGVMSEELALLTISGIEVASLSPNWPSLAIDTPTSGEIRLPDMIVV
ncbi:MAG: M24 family metallopeptidase [Anaerolineae bacterium]|nr:M24 family metallopeptidase [Anaerolineae bacterium]